MCVYCGRVCDWMCFYTCVYDCLKFNPFTAPACKISELKSRHIRPQTENVSVLYQMYFHYCAFRWKSFHALMQKRRERGWEISNWALFIVSVLYQMYFHYCAFRWKSFHALMQKRRERGWEISNWALFIVRFQVAVKGLMLSPFLDLSPDGDEINVPNLGWRFCLCLWCAQMRWASEWRWTTLW